MQSRTLGTRSSFLADRPVSVVGLGTWQLGADWGDVSESDALDVLSASVESGVTFFDTADVYGDGRSEQTIATFLRTHGITDVIVATKAGRRMEQVPENYSPENLRAWMDRSRTNLGVDTLDLVQLHCPPTVLYSDPAIYDTLDELVAQGVLAHYGVSVEKRSEALEAIRHPHVATVQIICNMLRQAPLDDVLPAAVEAGVGIIVRVPLASGLLGGRYDENTTFAPDDHRSYNRRGEAFDVGETFAGVDFATGLEAVRRIAPLTPDGATMAQFALRWVIDQPGVTTVIPGARTAEQARANTAAAALAPLDAATLEAVEAVYRDLVAPQVAERW